MGFIAIWLVSCFLLPPSSLPCPLSSVHPIFPPPSPFICPLDSSTPPPILQFGDMSATGTYRGTTSHKTVGRGRLPDFENASQSHIPRPRPDSSSTIQTPHTPSSDIGSSTMSAASSRQRQNQSKRDEVCHLCPCSPCPTSDAFFTASSVGELFFGSHFCFLFPFPSEN